MSTNNSQAGHSPSESFNSNTGNETSLSQLLLIETILTSQSPSIQLNMTNMIPSQNELTLTLPSQDNVVRIQQQHRHHELRETLRRQQQEQRRQEQEE